MINFLETQYPSKIFMPAIGVKKTTLHQWSDRGYIYLGRPGTGKSVILTGEEILYAACLVLLSKAGHSHKQMYLRGLRDCIGFFKRGIDCDEDMSTDMYALFKFVERVGVVDGEWVLSMNPFEKRIHITEAFGHKVAPYLAAVNLTELLKSLAQQIEGIVV